MNSITLNSILQGTTRLQIIPYQVAQAEVLAFTPLYAQNFVNQFESLINQGQAIPLSSNILSDFNESFASQVEMNLQQQIYTPNAEEQNKLNEINNNRMREGKPPINFQQITREIENIMNDPSLDDKKKKDLIGDIRKRLGLGKKDMKFLFTKRLARLHQEAAKQLQSRIDSLALQAKEAEKLYGKNSTQALQAHQALDQAKSVLQPQIQKYSNKAGLYNSMFPTGFFSKFGGFFKKIGSALGKVVSAVCSIARPILSFIPGVGQIANLALGALEGATRLISGNWKGFLSSLGQTALSLIPGASTLANLGMSAFNSIKAFASGNWLSGLSNLIPYSKFLPLGLTQCAGNFWNQVQQKALNLVGGIQSKMNNWFNQSSQWLGQYISIK